MASIYLPYNNSMQCTWTNSTASTTSTVSDWWSTNCITNCTTTTGTTYPIIYPAYANNIISSNGIIWQASDYPQSVIVTRDNFYTPSKHNSRRVRKLSREERAAAERALLAREAQEREARQLQQEREQRRVAAIDRSKELLLMHLSDDQRHELKEHGSFIVRGGNSGREYRIQASNNNYSGNVHVLGAGKKVEHQLCAHCDHTIPFHDQILSQKFMLESCEQEFLRIANRHA